MMRIFFLFLLFAAHCQAESLEKMVGEMLLVHFHGDEANCSSQKLLLKAHVGGFIFYEWANTLSAPEQVKKLTRSLEIQAKRPLFFAVDQEGGAVLRLKKGFSQPPANGQLTSVSSCYQWALQVAKELKAVGINMNLAPVVDVNSNPDNPIIGIRSYSQDPEIVAEMGRAALLGYEKGGVVAVLKHFPGHGDTTIDSHIGLPVIDKSLSQLNQVELLPFRKLVKNAPAIMTAHLLLPQLDPIRCATLSPLIIRELLIKNIGFNGVIITDSLAMEGVLKNSESLQEAAIEAIEAGHDILLLGGKQLLGEKGGFELNSDSVLNIHKAICEAVISGRLSEERIEKSYNKILHLKQLGLLKNKDNNAA